MKRAADEQLKTVSQTYKKGYTCSQAVFCAYAEDMGIDRNTACRLMEGFGEGMGGMQEVCGALAATSAIISYDGGAVHGSSPAPLCSAFIA